jgi:hypothetical protein
MTLTYTLPWLRDCGPSEGSFELWLIIVRATKVTFTRPCLSYVKARTGQSQWSQLPRKWTPSGSGVRASDDYPGRMRDQILDDSSDEIPRNVFSALPTALSETF